MANDRDVLHQTVTKALSGRDAHVEAARVFAGVDWKLAGARPERAPHSLFQLANHTTYWLEWVVRWLDGERPRPPKHAAGGWPGRVSPASRQEWDGAMRRLRAALVALERRSKLTDLLSRRGKFAPLEMLLVVASHTSYHVGQAAFLRQQLGAWPPPSGGVTW